MTLRDQFTMLRSATGTVYGPSIARDGQFKFNANAYLVPPGGTAIVLIEVSVDKGNTYSEVLRFNLDTQGQVLETEHIEFAGAMFRARILSNNGGVFVHVNGGV